MSFDLSKFKVSPFCYTFESYGEYKLEVPDDEHISELEKILNSEDDGRNKVNTFLSLLAESTEGNDLSLIEVFNSLNNEQYKAFLRSYVKNGMTWVKSYFSNIPDVPENNEGTLEEYILNILKQYVQCRKKSYDDMYADMASKRDLLGGFSDSTLSALAASTKASSILSKHAQSILAGPSIYDGFVPKMGEYSGLLGSDAGIVSRSIQENILDIDPIRDMPPLPHIDNPLDGTNNKIDKTNNKLDKLIEFGNKVIPIIPDAANVLNTMSQSVISMQADLFKSSQKAARLSLVMLAIAALTLIAGVFEVQDWFKDEEAITSATIIAIQKGYEDQLSIQSQETESLKLEIKKMKSEHEAQLEALRLELRQFNKVKANTNQLQKSK